MIIFPEKLLFPLLQRIRRQKESCRENSQEDLLAKLQSVVGGSASTRGTSRFNDTPQTHPSTFDEFTDPDYSTDITISKSASESEQTTEWDDTNIMKRIAEIQESYQNLMQRWVGEFDKFFWEE